VRPPIGLVLLEEKTITVAHAGRAAAQVAVSALRRALFVLLGCWLTVAAVAHADDVADEADVEFNLGAERYERADYPGALSHFLASNRLAQNRNVMFNIALCYERLGRLPEAYRYYARSLDGEPDPAVITRLESALARLSQRVALLHIVTDPPGARLYVDRKDLGERGASPQTMALVPGNYRVLAELDGYRVAESPPVELRVGVERSVALTLQRIVGTVRVEGPASASVHLNADDSAEHCQAPCDLGAAPGQHTLIVSRPGFRTARVPVSVIADQVSSLTVNLVPESGSLLVVADEAGATLEIDGLSRGSVPASVELPVGTHTLRVSLQGFQPIEQQLFVRADQQIRLDLKLVSVDVVEAASRLSEPVEEAPASITLIGSQELERMRYPTLAEALRGTRGVYQTNDTSYVSLGIRGLALPGSYGKRVLVTLDGMPTNEDWSWASFNGFDLRTDMEDIERIEVVRGPGSVVYGLSAFTGVVNLVSRGKEVPNGVETSASAASDGVLRARARLTHHLSPHSGFWASISGGVSQGRDFYFPEYVSDGPPELAGHVRGLDGARFGTFTGRAWWKDATLSWALNHHVKYLPAGQFEALLGDGRARQADTRGFLEARFEPRIGPTVTSLTRVHANLYAYRAHTPLVPESGGLDITHFDSYWFGAEQRFVFDPSPLLKASLGSEVQAFPYAHAREAAEVGGEYLNDHQQLLVAAAYGSLDVRPRQNIKLTAGARLDYYSNSGAALNPRLALIMQPYDGGNLKLLFGKAIIPPGMSETDYFYYNFTSNSNLRAEQLYSAEVELSHHFNSLVSATVAAYMNYATDLISLEELPPNADGLSVIQYQNTDTPIGTQGAEVELRREWKAGYLLAATYSLQRSAYLRSNRLGDLLTLARSPEFRKLPNAPAQLASVRAAAPILSRLLRVMGRLTFESGRYDRNSAVADPIQTHTEDAWLLDFVLSGSEDERRLEYSFGVYNALNSRAEHPVSSEFRQLSIPISGRSLLASVSVRF
jgi:outer membrane receptor protein involved in Fe transport